MVQFTVFCCFASHSSKNLTVDALSSKQTLLEKENAFREAFLARLSQKLKKLGDCSRVFSAQTVGFRSDGRAENRNS